MLSSPGDLAKFLGACSSKASSGACVVLATDKAATPPLFKALAAELGGALGFAVARKDRLAAVQELGLTRCGQCVT